jgi:hypothetical protein
MQEWMSEKHPLPSKIEPLEVNVEETMFVQCLPSPRNSMEYLRRSSISQPSYAHPAASGVGSAKKV